MEQHHDFESSSDAFAVKLDRFEGPLDLLLHLIKKNEVNIHDIPIVLITQQYLEAIGLMRSSTSTWRRLPGDGGHAHPHQVRCCCPGLKPRGRRRRREDPRDVLVRRLLEHQKFKAAAELLHGASRCGRRSGSGQTSVAALAGEDYEPELESTCSACSPRSEASSSAKQRPKVCAERADVGRGAHRAAVGEDLEEARRAGSKSSSPMPTIGAASSSRFWPCSR
jgi:hypothetical protein